VAGSYYSDDDDLPIEAQRLVELTDSASGVNVVDQGVIDKASRDAQTKIDGRLRGKYVVPFPPDGVPPEIQLLHVDIKTYFIFRHRDMLAVPDGVRDDYKQAMADLDDYADADGGLILSAPLVQAPVDVASDAGPAHGASFPRDPLGEPNRVIFGRNRDRLG
jgi:phage gp36-like protein